MGNVENFNSREKEKNLADVEKSGSIKRAHSARQSQLRSLGTDEERFLQGLKRSKSSENLGFNRKLDEQGLDRPSSSGKEKVSSQNFTESSMPLRAREVHRNSIFIEGKVDPQVESKIEGLSFAHDSSVQALLSQIRERLQVNDRQTIIKGHFQELEQTARSLSEIVQTLKDIAKNLLDDYNQLHSHRMKITCLNTEQSLEMAGRIIGHIEKLDKLVENYQISDGNFLNFVRSSISKMEKIKNFLKENGGKELENKAEKVLACSKEKSEDFYILFDKDYKDHKDVNYSIYERNSELLDSIDFEELEKCIESLGTLPDFKEKFFKGFLNDICSFVEHEMPKDVLLFQNRSMLKWIEI
jgi:hypothetical protein